MVSKLFQVFKNKCFSELLYKFKDLVCAESYMDAPKYPDLDFKGTFTFESLLLVYVVNIP